MSTISEMAISSIAIGDRVRKDMGDLEGLSASIKKHGLLHPPAVTSDGRLIAGHRRILACSNLGMNKIPVRIIDVSDLLSAERDENEVRKAFTPSEAVAIARVIEQELKERARANHSAGTKLRWAKKKGQVMSCDDSSQDINPRPKSAASAAVGMCEQRYRQAKEIIEAAEKDAAKFGDIVETMDSTNNVLAAHTELRRRRDNLPVRHAVLRNMHHRDPNKEVERAITLLSGLVMGIKQINVDGLDPAKTQGWAADLKGHTASINRFIRSINHEPVNQA